MGGGTCALEQGMTAWSRVCCCAQADHDHGEIWPAPKNQAYQGPGFMSMVKDKKDHKGQKNTGLPARAMHLPLRPRDIFIVHGVPGRDPFANA